MVQDAAIRLIDLNRQEELLALLALQLAAYFKEAEIIGLTDAPPLWDSPAAIRASGEKFYGLYAADETLAGAIAVKPVPLSGELAACAAATVSTSSLRICRLMVRPDRLRQGIASRLIRHILLTVSEPVGIVAVSAVTANTAAMALYAGFGFRPVHLEEAGAGGCPRQELAVEAAAFRRLPYALLLPETE